MSETTRQALLRVNTSRPLSEVGYQPQLRAEIIQDEFTGFGTADWRYKQRKKHDAQAARLEKERAMLEERARLAAERAPWVPAEEGWDPNAEPWE
jgi:hypothetical protein